MVPRSLLIALFLVASAFAEFGVEGIYDNLPLESTTIPADDSASGDNGSGDDGVANDQVPIDTDCSTREDGLYSIAACSPQFLTCSGGVDRVMDCPSDLIYDSRIVACEYPAAVPGCPGYIPAETTTEYVPESTTEEPESTTDVYEYTSSTEEPTTSTDAYDYTSSTEEPTTSTDAYDYTSSTEASTSSQAPESTSQRAADDRSCSEDGFFSYGECSDSYTACTNGRSIPMTCPSNLAFDQARQLCDYPMAVPECNNQSGDDQEASGEETTTAADDEASGDDATSTTPYYGEETTSEATTPSFQDETSTEATTPYYGDETTTSASQDETSTEATTPYYGDDETSTDADVPLTSTEPLYPEETTTEESQVYETEFTTSPASDITQAPTCVEGATQIEACSQNYNNCVNGEEAVFTCENGLLFSSEKSSCVPVEELPECQQQQEEAY